MIKIGDSMIIAMGCTANWYHYLVVDIYSLLRTTPNVKKIYLLVETNRLEEIPKLKEVIEKYPVEIEIINFNEIIDTLVRKESMNRNTIFSNFCFARLALPSIVKEEKVLYIDTDAIVLKDISRIWRLNIEDYYIAGCKDYGVIRDGTYSRLKIIGKYVNSGFILMNLKKIREDNISELWFKIINLEKFKYPDQDVLNVVCQKKEIYIPSVYNYIKNVTMDPLKPEDIKVMHYAGYKEQWVTDMYYGELWYAIEDDFYDEFGIDF